MNLLMKFSRRPAVATALALAAALLSPNAGAVTLNAPVGGSFTMNLDRDALAPYYGYFLSKYWDAAGSDYTNPANTGSYFLGQTDATEIPAINRVFDVTAIGADPTGQATGRHVKATSADFSIDSDTLAGVAGTKVGLAGVQGFFAPLWPPSGGKLVNGDFSVVFDAARQTDGRTGWYLASNIYFAMAVYDLSNLGVTFTDGNNWQLSGNLLMSPENAGMLGGASLTNVGDFCLGTGSFGGCGQVSAVPVPAAAWLFGSAMLALGGGAYRKRRAEKS